MYYRLLKLTLAFFTLMPEGFAKTQKLTIAATEWAPLTSSDMERNGLLADITSEALKRVGYETEFVILPWKRALEMTRKGRYDALLGASYVEERTLDFIYPQYAWRTYSYFHALKGSRTGPFKGLKSLCPATVGILIGSFHRRPLLESGCLKVYENSSIQQSMQMLMRGRIDLYLAVPEVLHYYLSTEFPGAEDDIITLRPAYIEDKAYLVFPKSLPQSAELARDYERGIELIKAEGAYAEVIKRHPLAIRP
ncbi:MAG TPA: transporter substrate-binding domain-containing protein [Oligoflexus sp.]|uniref:substrate-binding periplasmic protein n=1 Tax=Oligoflexus sp. TaxID=1971216 RepID=UPI002D7E90D3|nr:transporter substrate-binding domain-containing protein [Oligoflexus sp.]HET9241405.1 transporter substrate-binding domain-containing protein [Oligoflexus sp.]